MTVFVCAVADCKSSSWKKSNKQPYMEGVKGWAPFPSLKKEPARRKLWETRCKRGAGWKATKHLRICSKHFKEWQGNRPSPAHPDPECFAYNNWGKGATLRKKNALQIAKFPSSDAATASVTHDATCPPATVVQERVIGHEMGACSNIPSSISGKICV